MALFCLTQDSVGPDNIEGFAAVQGLSDYLFHLKDHSLALTREEAAHIVYLWKRLSDFDKGRAQNGTYCSLC